MRTARSSSCLLGGGVCLSTGCVPGDPLPGCGPGDTPPGCGPDPLQVWSWRDPPRPNPSTSPLGVGLETCKASWDTTCNACWDNTPLPHLWTEWLADTFKNITFANFVCRRWKCTVTYRGNKFLFPWSRVASRGRSCVRSPSRDWSEYYSHLWRHPTKIHSSLGRAALPAKKIRR